MSFRQFGGLQYASKHNAVASNYNTSNNLLVTQNVGQSNSYINFLSDISGNINIYGNLDISGNIDVSGDVDISGNLHVQGNIDCSGNGSFDNSIYIYDGSSYSVISENGTTLNLVNYSNGNTNINPSGQTGITVNSSGQVGIKNTSPSYTLDVSGNANITLSNASNTNPNLTLSGGGSAVGGAYLQLLGSGTAGENVGINFDTFSDTSSGRAGGPATTIRSVDNGDYSGNLEFLTANTGSSSNLQSVSMIIKPQGSGNAFVGIGTATPGYSLDVVGNLRTTMDASINTLTVGKGGGNVATNTAVGLSALSVNTTGGYNTAIGSNALMQNIDGQYHTAIGYNSGNNNTTGLCNTFLGYLTGISGNYDNSTAIGYNSKINASNQIVLGGAADNDGGYYPSVKIPGSYVGIGGIYNPSSGYALDISGNARIALGPSATNLNPALTLSGGVSGVSGAYLQFIGGGAEDANVGINLDTFSGRTGGPATTIRSIDNGGYSGNLEFLTANSNTSSSSSVQAVSMIIKPQATGNAFVGIGTIDPSYNLDVSGILQVQDGTFDPIYSTYLHGLNVSASNFYYNPKTPTDINSFKIELDGANCLIYKGTPNPFSYQDASATVIQNDGGNGGIALVSTSTYIYVNKNGSTPGVGIMTSNPQYTLDVSGNINFTGSLLEDGAPFSGTTQWTTYGLNIYYNTGTVGIGTASPNTTYKLDVNGKVNATLYNSTSDYRIKENVTQLDSTFVVDNLNPVTYLNNKLGKQDIGLIAHELQEIYPELVNGEKDGEQFQSVNYLGLIPILIKEIKELKKEIKSVKTELNELKNK